MYSDAEVEVHRIPHTAERAHAPSFDLAAILEDAARGLGQGTDLLGDRFVEFAALLIGVICDGFAVLLRLAISGQQAGRDVRDKCRLILAEHDHHLFG